MHHLSRSTQRCLCLLSASVILVAPSAATHAQEAVAPTAEAQAVVSIKDVALDRQGKFTLRVVDTTGQPAANMPVTVAFQGQEVAKAKSDANGTVTISGLRPGLHSVSSFHSSSVYRFWTPDQAPPSCVEKPALAIVDDATRGQYGPMMGYPMQPMMMGPGMIAPGLLATGITAAAVVVVLAGKNSGNDSVVIPPPSSP